MIKLLNIIIIISAITSVVSSENICTAPEICLTILDCKDSLKDNIPTNHVFRPCGNTRGDNVCCPVPKQSTAIVFEPETRTEPTNTIRFLDSTWPTTITKTQSTTVFPELELAERYLPTDRCGWRNISLDNKIYKGRNAEPGEFPWIVLLKIQNGESVATCGGTLISEWYVVTAAHCVYFFDQKRITITLGAADWRGTKSCSFKNNIKPKIRKVAKAIVHESYYKDRQQFGGQDIALLRMNRRINFNDCIQPACLPLGNMSKGLSRDDSILITAGWGTKGKSQKPSEILQVTEQIFVNNTDCGTRYKEQRYTIKIVKSQICTLGYENSRGLRGDSGSPLLSQRFMKAKARSGFRHILVGVLSSGPQDWNTTNAVPNIYIRVNKFIQWILTKLEP